MTTSPKATSLHWAQAVNSWHASRIFSHNTHSSSDVKKTGGITGIWSDLSYVHLIHLNDHLKGSEFSTCILTTWQAKALLQSKKREQFAMTKSIPQQTRKRILLHDFFILHCVSNIWGKRKWVPLCFEARSHLSGLTLNFPSSPSCSPTSASCLLRL